VTTSPHSFRPLFGALALVLVAVAYLGLYARAATLDVAYADYLLPPFITAIDACITGQGCLDALLAPTSNGYRWTVPALMLSLNAKLLGLNTRFELAVGLAGLALAALTMYLWIARIWLRSAGPLAVLLLFLPVLLFLFNLNQWENIVLGIGGYHLLGLAALLLCLWALDDALRAPAMTFRQAVGLFFALVAASLFLLQYFVVLAGVALLLTLLAWLAGQRRAFVVLAIVLAGAALGILLTFVPGASLQRSPAPPAAADLVVVARFFLNMLAASMLQWEGKEILAGSGSVLGIPALIAFALSGWLFFHQRMYRTSWLPLALCLYGIFAAGAVALSRFGYGAEYGFASRYTSQTVLAVIGCYLVLVKALPRPEGERGAIVTVAAFCTVAAMLQVATQIVQWQIAPHRKAYYREIVRVAPTFEQATDEELARFQVPLEATRLALPILRRHRLSYYR